MFFRSFVVVFVFVCLLINSVVSGQDPEFSGADARGPLNDRDAQKHLNRLLSLDMDRLGRLFLSHEVWDQHGKTTKERVDFQMKKLTEHMPENMRNHQATLDHWRTQIENSFYCSFTDVFEDLSATMHQSGRQGGGGSQLPNGYSLSRYSNSGSLFVNVSGTAFSISFSERGPSDRTVRVHDDRKRSVFGVTIDGKGFVLKAYQTADSLTVAMVDENASFVETTSNWNEFASKHPRQHKALMQTMRNVGFVEPVSPGDLKTAECVQSCLSMLATEKGEEFQLLIEQMRSDKEGVPASAAKKLMKIGNDVHYQIECLLDENDSSEFQKQLTEVAKSARRNSEVDVRYLTLVKERGLCDTPEYLIDMAARDGIAGKDLIFERLASLTGQQLGTDLVAWQDWISAHSRELVEIDSVATHESSAAENQSKIDKGFPEKAKAELAGVLCFQVDAKGRISVERESWIKHGPSYDELLERETQKYARFDLDKIDPRAWAIRSIGNKMSQGMALSELMNRVATLAGSQSSGQAGGGDDFVKEADGPEFSAITALSNQRFELLLNEISGPRRRLQVIDDVQKQEFHFVLERNEWYSKIEQDPEECRVIVLDDTVLSQTSHPSFSEFALAKPEIAQQLLKQMQQIGVDVPPTRASPQVREFVLGQLSGTNEASRHRFDELVKMLASDEFAKRQESMEIIKKGYRVFLPFIEEMSLDSIDPESRKSLIEIRELAKTQADFDRRFIVFAASSKLVEAPRYLVGILPQVSDQQKKMIFDQLQKITDANPGDDVDSWTRWVNDNIDP